MAYDQSILDAIYQRAQQVSDPSKRNRYLRAALQTGIVESGIQNLNHGDADSQGWRQERASLYKNPTNITASVDRFFNEAAQLDRGQKSWQLAADVQRPAAQYRGRYQDVAKDAASLLKSLGGGSGPSSQPASPTSTSSSAPVGVPTITDGGQASDFTSLLSSLIKPQPQAPVMSAVAPPQFSAQQALPQGFRALTPEIQQAPGATDGLSQQLALLDSLKGTGPTVTAPGAPEVADGVPAVPIAQKVMSDRAKGINGVVPLGGMKNAGKGAFSIEGPSPDRLKKPLVSFAEKVASIYGGELRGKDGSSHSKYTVNGNVSDHYAGNATDIFFIDGKPAQGQALIQAGRAALIAAGMPRAQALKAKGGLYNVGGHQIIFGVDGKQYGGNHLDHLHISAK